MGMFLKDSYLDRIKRALNKMRWNKEQLEDEERLLQAKTKSGLSLFMSRFDLIRAKAYFKLQKNAMESRAFDDKANGGIALIVSKLDAANRLLQSETINKLLEHKDSVNGELNLKNNMMRQLLNAQKAKEDKAFGNLHDNMVEMRHAEELANQANDNNNRLINGLLNKLFKC